MRYKKNEYCTNFVFIDRAGDGNYVFLWDTGNKNTTQSSFILSPVERHVNRGEADTTTIGSRFHHYRIHHHHHHHASRRTAIRNKTHKRQKIINSQQSNQSALRKKKIGRKTKSKEFFSSFFFEKDKKKIEKKTQNKIIPSHAARR